jgi:hypothetical protein
MLSDAKVSSTLEKPLKLEKLANGQLQDLSYNVFLRQ